MICYVEKEIFRSISSDKIIHRFEDMKKRRRLVPKDNLVVCLNLFEFHNFLHYYLPVHLFILSCVDCSSWGRRITGVIVSTSHYVLVSCFLMGKTSYSSFATSCNVLIYVFMNMSF